MISCQNFLLLSLVLKACPVITLFVKQMETLVTSIQVGKRTKDAQTIFGLYLQFIGTTGHRANIVKQFQPCKQGFNLHFAISKMDCLNS